MKAVVVKKERLERRNIEQYDTKNDDAAVHSNKKENRRLLNNLIPFTNSGKCMRTYLPKQ